MKKNSNIYLGICGVLLVLMVAMIFTHTTSSPLDAQSIAPPTVQDTDADTDIADEEVVSTHSANSSEEITSEKESNVTHQSTTSSDSGIFGLTDRFVGMEEEDVHIDSDDPIEIAKVYLNLYNEGKWRGGRYPVHCINQYGDFEVIMYDGEIMVNNEETGVKTDVRLFYDAVRRMYLEEEWDGSEMEFLGHTISRSTNDGSILCDGNLLSDFPTEYIDEPASFDYDTCNIDGYEFTYVPGHGCYTIANHNLVQFLRGKEIVLSGGELDLHWNSGYELVMRYYEPDDALYIFERDYENEYEYLFRVPDLSTSYVEYVGKYELYNSIYE